jgi:hypothetical protein
MHDDFTDLEATLTCLTPTPMSADAQSRTLRACKDEPVDILTLHDSQSLHSSPWVRVAAATLAISAGLTAWHHLHQSPLAAPSAPALSETSANTAPEGMYETPADLVLLPPPNADVGTFQPVSFESVVTGEIDQGLRRQTGAPPMRSVRRDTLTRRVWINSANGDRYIVTQPTSETLLVHPAD